MPRFRFRLQTLRRLREIHRDEQRGRLAAADSAYHLGLRADPSDSLLLARSASVERRLAPR